MNKILNLRQDMVSPSGAPRRHARSPLGKRLVLVERESRPTLLDLEPLIETRTKNTGTSANLGV
jgi:hypothetical protein